MCSYYSHGHPQKIIQGGAKPKKASIFPSKGPPIFPKKYWPSERIFLRLMHSGPLREVFLRVMHGGLVGPLKEVLLIMHGTDGRQFSGYVKIYIPRNFQGGK